MPFVCALGPLLKPYYEGNELIMKAITNECKEHITISYRTTPFEYTDPLEYWSDTIEIEVVGERLFGENNDIPVYEVRFVDERVSGEMERFHHLTELRQPGEYMPIVYHPHITRKHLTDQLAVGERLWAGRIFIKQVGSDGPPHYERHLNPVPRQHQ